MVKRRADCVFEAFRQGPIAPADETLFRASESGSSENQLEVDLDRSNSDQLHRSIQQDAFRVLAYDEIASWAKIGTAENRTDDEVDKFLEEHFQYRFDLIGGRIRLILTPSTSFAALRRDVSGALQHVSVEHLEKGGSLDMFSYLPSIVYSLAPGDTFCALYEIKFASPTIKQLVMAVVTQSKGSGVVEFLKECDKFHFAGSLLAEMLDELLYRALAHGGRFAVKQLIEGSLAGDTKTIELKPVLQQHKVDMNTCVKGTTTDYGVDEYHEFAAKSCVRVDVFISLNKPPNEMMPHNLLYQYPIGPSRFVPSRVLRLAKALGWAKTRTLSCSSSPASSSMTFSIKRHDNLA